MDVRVARIEAVDERGDDSTLTLGGFHVGGAAVFSITGTEEPL
jgi:hypothetical protein